MHLTVITGPTASGKTALAVETALQLGCDVVNADSRQIYRQIPIVTAAPTPQEMRGVRHHFVGTKNIDEYYSAAEYASDCRQLLDTLFIHNDNVVMCGGSMMYIDAVLYGIDDLPTISPEVRRDTMQLYQERGMEGLRRTLATLDPFYLREVDRNNPRRLIHAIEICRQSGSPYSQLRRGNRVELPFTVSKKMIQWPRQLLYERINARVYQMAEEGMVDEVKALYKYRGLNALNTVGCKEIFDYLDGKYTLDEALEKIARNTRVYAKKQLAWISSRHPDIEVIDKG